MVESSNEPSLSDPTPSSLPDVYASNPVRADNTRCAPPLTNNTAYRNVDGKVAPANPIGPLDDGRPTASIRGNHVADKISAISLPQVPAPLRNGRGEESSSIEPEEIEEKPNIATRFYRVCKEVLLSSWINVLLVFVPIGIAVKIAGVNKTVVFAVNAIAIVPLASLLSHATESVASEMGDTIGALMNVTFGNAVELIIFIALTKKEIRIVQASLLGSILANLLLILGMCFLFGGLRFREQIYNSTVTQMSACLLSLSVMSLLLPTAFHASFTNNATADKAVLKVSRGTSIILLLVYVLYLLFQLKSHAYMYQSTPQHVIDEESHPGVLADMLNSSSSSDSSSASSGNDSDGSSGSNTTAKRIKRVLRGRRRRKSSASSPSMPSTLRTPSASTFGRAWENHEKALADAREENPALNSPSLGVVASGDEADIDGDIEMRSITRDTTINFRDFENEKAGSGSKSPEIRMKRKTKRRQRKIEKINQKHPERSEKLATCMMSRTESGEPRPSTPHVGFVQDIRTGPDSSPKRSFNIRGLSVRDVVPAMPPMPKMLYSTVFSNANPTGINTPTATGITPRALHRSNSLPTRLNQATRQAQATPLRMQPETFVLPVNPTDPLNTSAPSEHKKHMSRTAAIILLIFSTGLVAVCAEFLVDSISYLIANTSLSEAFIGLIILPIVGNAAEHVTAVTVASKNKMDLAIGVAVGSSIQIALFVTPVIVLLGWILGSDMSLYFSLFETISLFVSAFIVNFLVLDGRSNYLEGALLIAAYVIIALAAFFYPDSGNQSTIGGAPSVAAALNLS